MLFQSSSLAAKASSDSFVFQNATIFFIWFEAYNHVLEFGPIQNNSDRMGDIIGLGHEKKKKTSILFWDCNRMHATES